MTREKKDSPDRRVILDLSFPVGHSVNSEIHKHCFEGGPYKLRLPGALDLAEHIAKRGTSCLLYKVDLSRAYRQLPSDPWDWPLLGIKWKEKTYFDTAIPFGVRHGAMSCQRTTEALCYLNSKDGKADSEAYIDDMATVCEKILQAAMSRYNNFLKEIEELGLQVSLAKCAPPSIEMTWVGVTFNSLLMLMWIQKSKVEETLSICQSLLSQDRIRKSKLQSILGKLNHCSKMSPPARRFMNRLFELLRSMGNKRWIKISKDAKDDLRWFLKFLDRYNCKAVIRSFVTDTISFDVDACLVGGGGISEQLGYFFYNFPNHLQDKHISQLECFNVLVCLRVFASLLNGQTVKIFCDNAASVWALDTGKVRDSFMACVLREVWFVCALNDIHLSISHKPGAELETADLLSRGYKGYSDWLKLNNFRQETKLKLFEVEPVHLTLPSDEDLNSVYVPDTI